jgi:hypothetical protein
VGFSASFRCSGYGCFPLGLILLAEDLPIVRRGVTRAFDRPENRWPHWFARPDAD